METPGTTPGSSLAIVVLFADMIQCEFLRKIRPVSAAVEKWVGGGPKVKHPLGLLFKYLCWLLTLVSLGFRGALFSLPPPPRGSTCLARLILARQQVMNVMFRNAGGFSHLPAFLERPAPLLIKYLRRTKPR